MLGSCKVGLLLPLATPALMKNFEICYINLGALEDHKTFVIKCRELNYPQKLNVIYFMLSTHGFDEACCGRIDSVRLGS